MTLVNFKKVRMLAMLCGIISLGLTAQTMAQYGSYEIQTYQSYGTPTYQQQTYQTYGSGGYSSSSNQVTSPTYTQPSNTYGAFPNQPSQTLNQQIRQQIQTQPYQYQTQPRVALPQSYQSLGTYSAPSGNTVVNQPTYQQGLVQASGAKYDRQGNRYDTNAGIGLDQRTDFGVGVQYDSQGNKFVGAQGSVGGGLYGDASVSQSGRIGKVDVRNYANGEAFLGTEAGAQAGLNQDGLVVGANGFSGGRVTGTVGTDVGPVGYGATGEAWAGLGAEAGVNAGFEDGVLTFGGELGAALGVGGKVGVQGQIDVGAIGNGIENGVRDVGRWGHQAGQDVGNWTKKAGQDVGKWTKNAGQDVGKWTKNAGRDIGRTTKNVGRGVENAAKDVGKGIGKAVKGIGGLFK